MKKLMTLFILAIFSAGFLNAQLLESFTAKAGYDFLNSQGTFTDMNIQMIMATEIAGTGMDALKVDMPEGTSSNWTFLLFSKDTTNKTMYSYTVLKTAGQFVAMPDSSSDSSEVGINFLNNYNWVNSDVIGTKIQANSDLMKFLNDNKDVMSFKYMLLTYSDGTELQEGLVWMAIAANSNNETAVCAYQGDTGINITCSINGVVGVKAMESAFASHFPNPSNGIINFTTNLNGTANIQIFDNSGNLVGNEKRDIQNNFQLNLSEMTSGIYNVLVTTAEGSFSKKVVILK